MSARPVLSRALVGGVLFLAVGLLALVLSSDLSPGTLRVVGPGALPIAVGLGLVLLSVVLIVKAIREPNAFAAADDEGPEPWGRLRVVAVVALIIAYIAVLPHAGFLLASFVLMSALFAIGAEKPFGPMPLVAGALASGTAWALFVLILDVRLPKGLLG
ncbi:tripartite tricarboxylate transporter TctB family protein [Rhodoplanes serenus]|jgi:putative tricarboxylic transport membrane protein|uniref:tripartite tricarboxylate transporter TctB family protein n=1 Tax=Rhodoplanes serenus TaxID=200615 RepID=UPI000DAC0C1B|nr:tripartite tricarboxylate transporter TctB family protein [Rhodoplanes serenus]RAI33388.1 hypothetical protein CH340_12465 [Rhodoplanes serenus]